MLLRLCLAFLFSVLPLAAPAAAQPPASPPALDRPTLDRMSVAASRALEKLYVEEEMAPKLAAFARERFASDAYVGLTPPQLARQLTADLRSLNGDGHLYAVYREDEAATPVPSPTEMDGNIAELAAMMRSLDRSAGPAGPGGAGPVRRFSSPSGGSGPMRIGAGAGNPLSGFQKTNYGFIETRSLEGNVGLIRIDRFAPPVPEALAVAEAAFAMVKNAEAVILDLRNCVGGVEAMASWVAGHFFAESRKPLLSAWFRFADFRVDSFTPDLPSEVKRPDVPVYILTSPKTFSSGELLSYSLQKFGRATLVGETTGGGGYAGQMVPLGLGIHLSVSVGRPEHPVTKTGWQKVGVIPDIAAPRGEALEVALRAARERLGG